MEHKISHEDMETFIKAFEFEIQQSLKRYENVIRNSPKKLDVRNQVLDNAWTIYKTNEVRAKIQLHAKILKVNEVIHKSNIERRSIL